LGLEYNPEEILWERAKSATKSFEELSIFSELILRKNVLHYRRRTFCNANEVYNGKRWIAYNVICVMGTGGSLVMQIFIIETD